MTKDDENYTKACQLLLDADNNKEIAIKAYKRARSMEGRKRLRMSLALAVRNYKKAEKAYVKARNKHIKNLYYIDGVDGRKTNA